LEPKAVGCDIEYLVHDGGAPPSHASARGGRDALSRLSRSRNGEVKVVGACRAGW
jgi:hypothetical protein